MSRYADTGDSRLLHSLDRVNAAANEVLRIVEVLGRLEETLSPEREEVDITVLCARLCSAYLARNPGVRRPAIRIQPMMVISGAPRELEVVLENLIANAIKFSAIRERPEVSITLSRAPSMSTVHVSDNGIGLAREDCERIFELFIRAHSGFDGTGVGLALCKRIVERHGGKIWATGELGLGSTISFYV